MTLFLGTSGWQYKDWRGVLYPAGCPTRLWLEEYAARFATVEINNAFYRLPSRETFEAWRERTPPDFVVAVKASRYLTHIKRLRDPEEPVARLFEHAVGLGARLGPVLYQLPASLERDGDRLARLLAVLPAELRLDDGVTVPLQHVFEFRHPSWYVTDTFAQLTAHGAALCLHDMAGSAIDTAGVGPFTYVRFHGAAGKYHGSYDDAVLAAWAARLAAEWRAGRDVYVYFNNDPEAVATHDARRLRDLTRAAAGLARGRGKDDRHVRAQSA